ncbi:alpha-amylase [Treponema sp. TIM-1]
MEFHIRREVREEYGLEHTLFSLRGNVILADFRQVRELSRRFNAKIDPVTQPERVIKAGQLNAMGLIDEILHYMAALYRQQVQPDAFDTALTRLENTLGPERSAALLRFFSDQFPPQAVYAGKTTVETYLDGTEAGESCRSLSVEELLLLALANLNPAFNPFKFLFDDQDLTERTVYVQAIAELRAHFAELPPFGPDGLSLWDLLRSPALASPDSLVGQLEFMRKKWGLLLGKYMARLLTSLDVIKEEEKPSFFGPGPTQVYTYGALDNEYERFSPDQDWMPRTVLLAKSTLVWLYQLTKKYGRPIERLDQIPDEELDELARRGFSGLWLIGLWERSNASKTVKQWTGNPEAAASAYSLYDYDIAGELGGWESLASLRERCGRRGIRLGSDMVPNHTGIDSRWVMEHPDRFLQLWHPPFPTYTFNGGNLSNRDGVGVYIEDHYYNRSDAAVVFKRVDFNTGDVRYIYHGNDGTSMPWNDTAQIDFLNPEAREAVIRTIVGVCRQFSIVRFDAAMTLAKRHIQRLWYPEPGHGGDIASRAEHAISTEEFNRRIPNEFWREVVDRCAEEAPNTLLLAEAFWMMEGYFVRTLGMHRVYNSAFMNMLKNEENAKYRATIKNTLEFDPEILKRFVNFMNNPDEETAVAQFGKGDKYFGICTLLVTMPGLPMFGHGQIEGFEEKYGMEYRRSYRNETADPYLVDRHEREIFPLMKKRAVFSGSAAFRLYDLFIADGGVNENVFAYSNRDWDDRSLVLYNNSYYATSGWIRQSSPAIPQEDGSFRQETLGEALSLHNDGRYFTLFREQRSGLWYIRSSKDINERGLFVSLSGYDAQVFLDIHEVGDLNGRWARLNHELSGRGVPDLQAAIQDLFLGALYRPFMTLFKEKPQDTETLRKPVLDFIITAREYINGGSYDPFHTGWDHPPIEPERIWEEFAAYFDRRTLVTGNKAPAELGTDTARFLEKIRERVLAKPYIADFVLAYGALSLLRSIIGEGASGADAAALMDHWRLDRKLRDCFSPLEIPADEANRVIELMRLVLSRTSPEDIGPYQVPPLGESLILANYNTEDFRKLLGINLFEDTVWFNKESFEEALFYVPLFLAMEGEAALEAVRRPKSKAARGKTGRALAGKDKKTARPAPGATDPRWLARLEGIAKLTDRFERAEKASGYKLERLIELLSEGGGEPESAGGKRAGKKAAPKKTAKKP